MWRIVYCKPLFGEIPIRGSRFLIHGSGTAEYYRNRPELGWRPGEGEPQNAVATEMA